jgi:hypothetical protein
MKRSLVLILLLAVFVACGPLQFIPEDSSYTEEYELCLEYETQLNELDQRATQATDAFVLFNDAIESGDEELILNLPAVLAPAVLEFESIYNSSILLEPNFKNHLNKQDTVKSFDLLLTSASFLFAYAQTGNMEFYFDYEEVNEEFIDLSESFNYFQSCENPVIEKTFFEALLDRIRGTAINE